MVGPLSVCEELCGFLRTSIFADGVAFDENTPFVDIGVDSLAMVQLLLFIERRYGILIPDAQLVRANLHSVSTLALCVLDLLSKCSGKTNSANGGTVDLTS
jgi:acyl carrier protein